MKRPNVIHLRPSRVVAVLASNRLFWVLIGLFGLQALWLALSGRYPMAFDEDFHLGIIRLYAHHPSPFWTYQPANADMYGAVARDPSYLYQWLMSFPYRLIGVFTSDQTIQVLWLRVINITLFISGLVLFRRVLRRSGASPVLIHGVYAAFILIPVMSLLAAQINYDNLLLPVVAVSLLLTLDVTQAIRRRRPLPLARTLVLICVCLLGSLVKYAFLPIFLAIAAYVVWQAWHRYGGWRKTAHVIGAGWSRLSVARRWLLLSLVLVCLGLFGQRYHINTVKYHTPIPDCAKVLSVEACSQYSPWVRDYDLKQSKAVKSTKSVKVATVHSPITFTEQWFYGMWLRLFFAVDGPSGHFETRGPLLLPGLASIIVAIMAISLSFRYAKSIWRRYDRNWLLLISVTSVTYLGLLWFDEYRDYLQTGEPVAINGRYLLPVLLPLLLIGALAFNAWLAKRHGLKLALLTAVLLTLLWGGGALTYILRSNDRWYWPSWPVRDVNQTVRQLIGPAVPGYHTPTLFLR